MGVCSTMAGMAGVVAAGVAAGVGVGVGVGVAAGVGAGVAATVAGVGVGVGSSPPQAATRARMAIMTMAVARDAGLRLGRRCRCTVVSPFAGCLWEWGYVSRLGVVL